MEGVATGEYFDASQTTTADAVQLRNCGDWQREAGAVGESNSNAATTHQVSRINRARFHLRGQLTGTIGVLEIPVEFIVDPLSSLHVCDSLAG